MAKWQQKCRVDRDATDGRKWRSPANGVGNSDGDGKIERKAKEEYQDALALVLYLAKAFERVSLPVVWARATHLSFPRKILRVLCGYFEHQRRLQFEGCVAEPLRTIMAIVPGSKWSCLLLRIVLQDSFE